MRMGSTCRLHTLDEGIITRTKNTASDGSVVSVNEVVISYHTPHSVVRTPYTRNHQNVNRGSKHNEQDRSKHARYAPLMHTTYRSGAKYPCIVQVLCINSVGIPHMLIVSGTVEERGPLQIRKSRGLFGSILSPHLSAIDSA